MSRRRGWRQAGCATLSGALALATACHPSAGANDSQAVATPAAAAGAPGVAALPQSGHCPAPLSWGALRPSGGPPPPIEPVRNKVSVDRRGTLYWNGTEVDLVRLRQYLDITSSMNPRPLFNLVVDPATPCENVNQLVALASQILDCARACSFAERRFDPREILPPPPPPPAEPTEPLAELGLAPSNAIEMR